jgi:hypothetical protein
MTECGNGTSQKRVVTTVARGEHRSRPAAVTQLARKQIKSFVTLVTLSTPPIG